MASAGKRDHVAVLAPNPRRQVCGKTGSFVCVPTTSTRRRRQQPQRQSVFAIACLSEDAALCLAVCCCGLLLFLWFVVVLGINNMHFLLEAIHGIIAPLLVVIIPLEVYEDFVNGLHADVEEDEGFSEPLVDEGCCVVQRSDGHLLTIREDIQFPEKVARFEDLLRSFTERFLEGPPQDHEEAMFFLECVRLLADIYDSLHYTIRLPLPDGYSRQAWNLHFNTLLEWQTNVAYVTSGLRDMVLAQII